MSVPKICFIGGGNMAEAIFAGLLSRQHPTSKIVVTEPFEQRAQQLREKYSISVYTDNNKAIAENNDIEVVILAVKPQVVSKAVKGISADLRSLKPLVVSIVAGVRVVDLERWIHGDAKPDAISVPVVRLMPNTPALVGEGAAGMYGSSIVSDKQRGQTEYIVQNIAKEYFWCDKESGIDAVTAISGSGPAYFFLVLEAMEKAGVELGLDAKAAKRLAAQTCLGAAKMVLNSDDEGTADLRRKVTSPNGTTQAAIEAMQAAQVPEGIFKGCIACNNRSVQLADEFGKDEVQSSL
ncbi:hypothetical protein H4219_003147 [Mycoemilia scoparia]|uniref:Pyrroline-5-carboxylate reductase n=1 Tax=Mycoemilia scoparia TaxID=417184 RepID=A0A9W8DTS5_9FUNG|nr:hypothetical protein H4219_003147 [Mycoemilia scoparia]